MALPLAGWLVARPCWGQGLLGFHLRLPRSPSWDPSPHCLSGGHQLLGALQEPGIHGCPSAWAAAGPALTCHDTVAGAPPGSIQGRGTGSSFTEAVTQQTPVLGRG